MKVFAQNVLFKDVMLYTVYVYMICGINVFLKNNIVVASLFKCSTHTPIFQGSTFI